jgi:predicted O-methyltransferase YrrM
MAFQRQIERLRALGFKKALQMKWENFLWTKLFSLGELFGLSILPAHFYSPVPDTRILRQTFKRWYAPSSLAGVDIDMPRQEAFLQHLAAYKQECASLPDYESVTRQGLGEGYSIVDAHTLYLMLRHAKPQRVIEVGSGVSTLFALEALAKNNAEGRINAEASSNAGITCIEPFPRRGLQKMSDAGTVRLVVEFVQNVPIETFQQLGENDVLFIDSSHVLKTDSDVQYLYLEVLPRLNKGVIIHIHDIFFPYPTPEPETWIFRQHQFWNESPLVQAFLAFNPAFEILLCGSYLHHYAPNALQSVIAAYYPDKNFAGSLWIKKVQ